MKVQHIAIAIFVTALWGLNGVVSKVGLREFPPLFYAALRFAISLPIIFFVAKPDVRWRYIFIIGLVWGVLQFSFLNLALYLGISVGICSLVLQSSVFFAMLFSSVLLREHPTIFQIVGICIGLAGIAIIGCEAGQNSTLLGFMLAIAGAVSWGLGNVIVKKTRTENEFGLMVWVSAVPALPLLAISFLREKEQLLNVLAHPTPWTGIGCALYAGFISALLGGTLWLRLFKNYSVTQVTAYGLLVPIFGVGFGAFLLGENISLLSIIAGGLIIVGLFISQMFPRIDEARVADKAEGDQRENMIMPVSVIALILSSLHTEGSDKAQINI